MTTALLTDNSNVLELLTSIGLDYKVTLTLPNGSKVSATKIGDDTWRDDQSYNSVNTADFATKISSLPDSCISTLSVITSPWVIDTPDKLIDYTKSSGSFGLNTDLLNTFNSSMVSKSQSYSYQISPFIDIDSAGQQKNIDAVDKAIKKIDAAKELLLPDLSQSQKVLSTNVRKRLLDFKKVLNACLELNNGIDVSLDVFDAGINNLNKDQFPFDISSLKANAKKAVISGKFKKQYGFNLTSGSPENYAEIVVDLNPDYTWVKYLIGHHDSYITKLAGHLFSGASSYEDNFFVDQSTIDELKSIGLKNKFNYDAEEYLKSHDVKPALDPNGLGFPDFSGDYNSKTVSGIKYVLSGACPDNVDYDHPEDTEVFSSNLGHLGKYVPNGIALSLRRAFGMEESGPAKGHVIRVIRRMLLHGVWYPADANICEVGSHKIALDPGMDIYSFSSYGYKAFVPRMFVSGAIIQVSPNYGFDMAKWDSIESATTSGWTLTQKGSSTIEYKDSKTFGKNFSETDWNQVVDAEDSLVVHELTGGEILSIKKSLDAGGFSDPMSSLPLKVRNLVAVLPEHLNIILFKNDWGHYGMKEGNTPWQDFQNLHSEFKGLDDPSDSAKVSKFIATFSVDDTYSAITTLGGVNNYNAGDVLGAKFALREAILNWEASQAKIKALGVENGVRGILKPIPSLHMGGGQAKSYFTDPDGNLFLGKPNPVDKFRPDAEYAANEIGRMFGYSVPESAVREIDGVYTHVQRIVSDVDHDLMGVNPIDLSDETLIHALRAHPLHWSIANHDLTGENFLVTNTNSIYVIDLGQAWKALGKDKLEVGWKLAGNYGTVWYNPFFYAVQNGSVPIDRLNKITKAVLRKAKYISEKRDNEFVDWLEVAFANRTFYPDGMSKQNFIDLAMARKHSVFSDFLTFYQGLYSDGGYDFNFDDKSFSSTRLEGTDAHLAVDDSFAEQVKKNAIYGKSVFFADSEIEDSHAFFYTMQRGKGTAVQIEMKIRKDGDKKICEWIKGVGVSGAVPEPVKPEPTLEPLSNKLPWADDFIQKLVAFAKTVNHHYSDKQYNKDTVNVAKVAAADIKMRLGLAKMSLDSLGTAFHTTHQRDHWIVWAENSLKEYESVLSSYESQSKAPMVSTSYSYTAPKVEAPKPVEKPKPVISQKSFHIVNDTFKTLQTSEASHDGVTTFVQYQPHFSKFKSYKITSSSNKNVTVFYVAHDQSGKQGTNYANTGRLQVELLEWDGSAEQLNSALDFVRTMGIPLEEATDFSLELFFWRHLANILRDRKRLYNEDKVATKISSIKMNCDDAELQSIKDAFKTLWGDKIVDEANWHPRFSDFRAHFLEPVDDPEDAIRSGRPYWMRPDFSLEDYKKFNKGRLPWRTDGDSAYLINGGYLANEEKIRFTGRWGARSNSSNEDREKGSSQFSFVRQGSGLGSHTGFYIEPEVFGRTHNYAFDGDQFGAVNVRTSHSPFNFESMVGLGDGGGANELMIKYGWSTWDDVAILMVPNSSERTIMINFYKSKGITEIRGLPVEDRIVYNDGQAQVSIKKIWDMYLK